MASECGVLLKTEPMAIDICPLLVCRPTALLKFRGSRGSGVKCLPRDATDARY